jgi:formylglycine-generating enzyme required for sulfatase activity
MNTKCHLVLTLLLGASGLAQAQSAAVSLAPGGVFADCANCPEMVVIPPGSFTMGYEGGVNDERYEGPPHPVSIDYSFAFGRLEITQAQFAEFVADTNYQAGTDCRMWTGETVEPVAGKDWRDPGYGRPPRDDDPVACVSWYDAKAYVAWLAKRTDKPYRLPTEAEWEYVAHGGDQTAYSWGDDPDAGCAVANYYDQAAAGLRPWEPVACNDGQRIVAPVGSLAPNPFGVYDITGNVWEWAEDCYLVPYSVQPTDGTAYQTDGACEKRVVRGGAWHSRATWQRPTFRGRDTEDFVTQVFGIRVVRELP